MTIASLIPRFFWIVFILVTVINVLIIKSRSKRYIVEKPWLEHGYAKIFKAMLIYGNIPWLIMGIGNTTGLTKSMFWFFAPWTLNPIVLLFHLYIIGLYFFIARWIYFRKGAEFLENYPGIFNNRNNIGLWKKQDAYSATHIKFFFAVAMIGGIVGMIMMWVIHIPFAE